MKGLGRIGIAVCAAIVVFGGYFVYRDYFGDDASKPLDRESLRLSGQQRIADACPPQDDRTQRQIRSVAKFYALLKSTESANWSDMLREEYMRTVFDNACLEAIAKAIDLDGYAPR